ncbi:MAG: flagellar motor protein MotB [Bdellovibrio sp.]|nr:flagellar motor protein MotB [Bdellovibrio sp.]
MKKKHPEHVNLERWLVSYADFITLLFAFFVIMYAISQADLSKFKKVSQSIRAAFSAAGPVGMVDLGGSSGGNTANPLENPEIPGGRVINMPAGKTNTAGDPEPGLQEVKELLEETISLELGVTDLSEKMQMQFDSRGLIVRLAAKDFFDHGAVDVKPDLLPLLDRMGKVLLRTRRLIRIEGHTDPSEASTKNYPSDWELSSARAAWVAKYWLGRFEFDPKRLGIAGYSHYQPLTQSTHEWGKASNRRVEIIVLNQQYESL